MNKSTSPSSVVCLLLCVTQRYTYHVTGTTLAACVAPLVLKHLKIFRLKSTPRGHVLSRIARDLPREGDREIGGTQFQLPTIVRMWFRESKAFVFTGVAFT